MSAKYVEIKAKLALFGQEHLLQFWDELSDKNRDELLKNIDSIDFKEAIEYFKSAITSVESDITKLDDRMSPVPKDSYGSLEETELKVLDEYKNSGLKCISNNEVGVLLLAGGQGTRLGVQYPKGMYSVNLLSEKSLFQLQAERIQKLQQLSFEFTAKRGEITWYIMTSEHTMLPTQQYLKENNYFGLNSENVVFFEQGKFPCFDFDGKVLLNSKCEVSQSPNGNGGLYRALKDQKIIEDFEKRGVKYLHVHSVDNILVQVADPIFIGFCVVKNANCAAKVVKKVVYNEAVGVVCKVDNKFQVVEYSEITELTSKLTNDNNDLLFSAGNICNHFFTADFLRKVAFEHENGLKLHVAKKKIPYIDLKTGLNVKPTVPNGIKIEKFIFDVFQFSDSFVTWEVPRNFEFSALKNADSAGKDCPSTARNDLYALHKKYVEQNGGTVIGNDIEISPLVSYAGEGLSLLVKGKTFTCPYIIE